ncbi:hypothetical protein RUM43_002560 [Polyplax serrata]|uniref:Uncharacterized protein n=1 Tax=Polyplax serrata TaxID=468196 RepID=A0AAN8NZ00_POLSC
MKARHNTNVRHDGTPAGYPNLSMACPWRGPGCLRGEVAKMENSITRINNDWLEKARLDLGGKKCEIRPEVDIKTEQPKDLTNNSRSSSIFPAAQIKMRLLSPSTSPATSPTMSNSSSPTPPALNYNHKITGIPCVAAASRYTAPVHIDVGGTIYTSSLETLTKAEIPIVYWVQNVGGELGLVRGSPGGRHERAHLAIRTKPYPRGPVLLLLLLFFPEPIVFVSSSDRGKPCPRGRHAF